MASGLVGILHKGGPWAQFLVAAFPLWLVGITALLVSQRQLLDRRLASTTDEIDWTDESVARDEAIEGAVSRFTASLGPFAGGGLCATLVASWWLVSVVAWISSQATDIEIFRIFDSDYVASLSPEAGKYGLAARHTAALITRTFIGILGCPATIVSILALDQALMRPRTRLLDDLRLKLLLQPSAEAEAGANGKSRDAVAALRARAHASWSWQAASFGWIWLLIKGLLRQGFVVLLVYFTLLITTNIASMRLTAALPDPFSMDPPVDFGLWPRVWAPTLIALGTNLPSLALSLVLAVKGHGWLVERRIRSFGLR